MSEVVARSQADCLSWRREHRERLLGDLIAAVAIPSISADPAYQEEVRRCAAFFVRRLQAAGMPSVRLAETRGNPVVHGEWIVSPDAPTVLIYGHYDVQPVDPLAAWISPPFEATVRDGKVYGRGTVDDKGQVLMHAAAIEAYHATVGAPPVNVKIVLEGEEEIGSPHFDAFLNAEKERLACDYIIVSDTAVFAEDVPSLTVSLRGLVHWDVTVQGPSTDLHSGYFGGMVKNPIEALAEIIAGLKDSSGKVTVPGFYDDVVVPDQAERREIAALPFERAGEAAKIGVPELTGEIGFLPLERVWRRPTLECNGIWGGYQGPGSKTIVPSSAHAKMSARLVADQNPRRIKKLVEHAILANAPKGVVVSVVAHGDVRAVSTARDHPVIAAAARAMTRGFGRAPAFIGTGGTIGPVSLFDTAFDVPQILLGVGLPDDAIHAPNEKFTLRQYETGTDVMIHLYQEIADLGRPSSDC